MKEELTAAHDVLLREYHAADAAGEWQDRNVLGGLVDVMDMVVRIASVESSHYRATKALQLVQGALTVRREVFNNFADGLGTDIAADEWGTTSIDDLTRMVEAVEVRMTSVMWSRTWGEPIYRTEGKALCEAVVALSDWAQLERAAAVRDPEELR